MSARHPSLTPAELEVMREIWARGEVTVRDVYEAVREHRPIAYTTVLTVMKVLEQKGHLRKSTRNRAHVYRAARTEAVVMRSMVREFVERVFGGAARPLLVHLVEDRRLTRRELAELTRMLDDEEEK